MENNLGYSFDDEYVTKFCYDMDNKKIEVHFTAYSDLLKSEYIEAPCIWVIESWLDAKSKTCDEEKFYKLDKYIGIFSMILFMEKKGDDLEIIVNTIDDRYLILIFIEPKISLNV